LPGHEYFCEVAEDFIEDDFNLTGLNGMVPFWKEAMEMVLDVEAGEYPAWLVVLRRLRQKCR
jgi:casein kinase II subunit beta